MKKPTSWKHLDDEAIEDEIKLILKGITFLFNSGKPQFIIEKVLNEYLDKLKTLYDEQRKRGTFKGS